MALLTGLTADGTEVPVQVKPDGKLVAEGLAGPIGPAGAQGPAGPEGPVGPRSELTRLQWKSATGLNEVDFTGIPSWAKRITVVFNQLSPSGDSHILIQVGSGSFATANYGATGVNLSIPTTVGSVYSTQGFLVIAGGDVVVMSGHFVLTPAPGSNNGWVGSGVIARTDLGIMNLTAGQSPNLSGPLDRIRVGTVAGAQPFDQGSIEVIYE